uniref:Uncharacterized protein n=1 Tax=Anguilla anguilla TaxID=7936 RepID=A0A0E9SGQ2_ANGAN
MKSLVAMQYFIGTDSEYSIRCQSVNGVLWMQ